MAPATIPTTEPTEVIAGLTWRWDRVVTDYTPAGGWSLKYVYHGGASSSLSLTGVASADQSGWELTAAAADTTVLEAGLYAWTAYVEKAAEKFVIGTGRLSVLPNPLTAEPGSFQPYAEKALAAVEAALLVRAAADMSSYTIKQRTVQREELDRLEAMRSRLIAELEAKRGGSVGRRVEFWPRAYR